MSSRGAIFLYILQDLCLWQDSYSYVIAFIQIFLLLYLILGMWKKTE